MVQEHRGCCILVFHKIYFCFKPLGGIFEHIHWYALLWWVCLFYCWFCCLAPPWFVCCYSLYANGACWDIICWHICHASWHIVPECHHFSYSNGMCLICIFHFMALSFVLDPLSCKKLFVIIMLYCIVPSSKVEGGDRFQIRFCPLFVSWAASCASVPFSALYYRSLQWTCCTGVSRCTGNDTTIIPAWHASWCALFVALISVFLASLLFHGIFIHDGLLDEYYHLMQ